MYGKAAIASNWVSGAMPEAVASIDAECARIEARARAVDLAFWRAAVIRLAPMLRRAEHRTFGTRLDSPEARAWAALDIRYRKARAEFARLKGEMRGE